MSVQMPLFEKSDSRHSVAAARLEATAHERFNVRTFADNFEELVNAAGSAKHLKEMVLQLAVRGRFSRPSAETADSLVAELQRARGKLARTGIRIPGASLPVSDDEAPYSLPTGWRWLRLGDLGGFLGGGTPSKSNTAFWRGTLPWVSPKDMKRPYIEDAEDHISMSAVEGSSVKLIPSQSVLYVVRGMILAHSFPVAVTTREVTVNQDMKALVLALPALSEFILRSCQAARTRVLAKVERSSHGTCRLESEAVEMLPLALPPLAEQKRIVAKVNDLMALCDNLEARQTKKRGIGARLTKSALDALASADGPEEFDVAWKRVVENFDVLVDRADMVAELRVALVDLASRGRLTSRCSQGRPVAEVLEARKGERRSLWEKRELARLRRSGREPRDSKWKAAYEEPAFAADEALPALPAGWAYAPIGLLGADPFSPVQTGPFGAQLHSSEFVAAGVPVIAVGNLTGTGFTENGLYFITDEKAEQLGRYDVQAGDLLFARSGATLGKVCVAPANVKSWRMTGHILRVRLDPRVIRADVASHWLWASAAVKEQIASTVRGGTRPGYNTALLESIVLPIPPLEEQTRIVEKVEQLMQICDDLEAKLRRAEDRAAKLVESAAQKLVA